MNPWQSWSQCTKTCSGGQQYRSRVIVREAQRGGRSCQGRLDETRGCFLQDCPGVTRRDCRWADWSHWDVCSVTCGDGETSRVRVISVQPQEGGRLCDALQSAETARCKQQPCGNLQMQDCLWSLWQEWSPCSKTCGTGEQHRSRSIALAAAHGGAGCQGVFQDFRSCEEPCPSYGQDCGLGPWTPWSDCSATCQGHHSRARSISVQKQMGGSFCHGSLEDTRPCNDDISCITAEVDCQYDSWMSWSHCSRSCGGGLRQRRRNIKQHAKGLGHQCSGDTEQVEPCGASVCDGMGPVDCLWDPWQDWDGCSTSCGLGQQRRQRRVAREAAHYGHPCEAGGSLEIRACQKRLCLTRAEICAWATWSAWSECRRGALPVTCGGGERKRSRFSQIRDTRLARLGGGRVAEATMAVGMDGGDRRLMSKLTAADCKEFQEELESCAEDECSQKKPVDCVWAAWQEWSACPCSGMHERHRRVAAAAVAGGEPCQGPEVEAEPCVSDCGAVPERDCRFSQWTSWSACPVTCGGGYGQDKGRVRYRVVLQFPQGGGAECDGGTFELQPCAIEKCPMKVDCHWGDWSTLSACTTSCGGGMASRSREVVQLPQHGGKRCEKNITMMISECNTEACPSTIRNCEFSIWNDWQGCSLPCGGGQQHRSRIILVEASEGGDPCQGDLQEFKECNMEPCNAEAEIPCVWGQWSRWSACSSLCNGHQERHRSIVTLPQHGGKACSGPQKVVRGCNLDTATCRAEAPRDCEFGAWRGWSACSQLCDGGQRSRDRLIEVHPANMGRPCHGSLDQTEPCNTEVCMGEQRYDCLWKPWEEWEACTQSCNGGQRTRRRSLVDARGHGSACQAGSTMEVAACNTKSCWSLTEVCEWSDWSPYSACSRSCDSGQQTRLRKKSWQSPGYAPEDHLVSRRLFMGEAPHECLGRQKEIRACGLTPCSMASASVNCQWETWSGWGDCSCSGLQSRHRGISVQAFQGGIPCVGASQDSKSCKPSSSCTSLDVNCTFGGWSSWSGCSVTCGNGQRYHTRAVITHAQAAGQRCHGGLEEVEACEEEPCASTQDCAYTEWSSWAACSRDCGGGEHARSRVVARAARSGGAECPEADLEETGPCNSHDCIEDAWGKIDCTWSEWSSWGRCSASCGQGQARRTRIIVQEAAHGGEVCSGFFQDFQQCSIRPCVGRDCSFSAWSAWSDCSDKCTGHRQRSRIIASPAFGGGGPCRGATMELRPCGAGQDEFCLSNDDALDCIFGAWTTWSACSRECGGGQHISSRQVLRFPQAAGKPCEGALRRVEVCSQHFCPGDEPVDCELGAWGLWLPCTRSCGGGEAQRSRMVSREPRNGGRPCAESFTRQVQECNTRPCPEESLCIWTQWSSWSSCSAECGMGQMTRNRSLFHPDFASLEALDMQLPGSLIAFAISAPQFLFVALGFLALVLHFWRRCRAALETHEASYMPVSTIDQDIERPE